MRDAVALGLSLSLAHVLVVVVVALVALWVTDFFWPERAARWFALGSGLAICAIGLWLFVMRVRSIIVAGRKGTAHGKDEGHDHHHHWGRHGDNRVPSHYQSGELSETAVVCGSWRQAAALGLSSGVVPCPKALVILLLAISLHRITLGLGIVAAFSLGMASVLVAIGLAMVKARHLVEHRLEARGAVALGVLGALVIIGLGVLLAVRAATGT